MEQIFYLSFAGDEGWRGCIHVLAEDFIAAVVKTHRMKINPGGEVASTNFPADEFLQKFPQIPLNKLLSREDMERLSGPLIRMFDDGEEDDG